MTERYEQRESGSDGENLVGETFGGRRGTVWLPYSQACFSSV